MALNVPLTTDSTIGRYVDHSSRTSGLQEHNARRCLKTSLFERSIGLDWGRYAELFSYDEPSGEIFLEDSTVELLNYRDSSISIFTDESDPQVEDDHP